LRQEEPSNGKHEKRRDPIDDKNRDKIKAEKERKIKRAENYCRSRVSEAIRMYQKGLISSDELEEVYGSDE
jgi:hypothetical protein